MSISLQWIHFQYGWLMKKNKTICLCAIVRDESKVIKRLIDSVRDYIDYYVIIDTGSKDDTIKVIKRSTKGIKGEIHKSKWRNFGENRTELMHKAKGKGDYLLLMDADMVVNFSKGFNKNNLGPHKAYYLRYTGEIAFSQLLLVSGHEDWQYIGYTHEYIFTKDLGKTPILTDITITHHADGSHRPEKIERDLRLLHKAIEENPEDSRAYFYLAQTYALAQKFEEAIKYYTERVRRGGWQEEVYYSLHQIGVLNYRLGNIDSAIAQFHESYSYRPHRYESLYMLGLIFRERKKYHLAKLYFDQIIAIDHPETDLLFVHRHHKEYLADFELAICNYYIGNLQKAKQHGLKIRDMDLPEEIKNQNQANLEFVERKLDRKKQGKNEIVYVSMFTIGTPYEEEIKILQKSLDKFNLFYELYGLKSLGSWEKNTQMKPQVIRAAMDKHNRDVVWLDADAVVNRPPEFFETIDGDISYYTIKQWNEMLTGTLYFRNTDRVKHFLEQWKQLNDSNNKPDAVNFQQLMLQARKELVVEDLPGDYIKIFDNPHIQSDDPVITHNQASRRFKSGIKTEPSYSETILNELRKVIGPRGRCAIIGNGPYVSDLSELIDNKETFVFRCNNFKTGKEHSFIGSKTDVNISSLYEPILPPDKVNYPIFGVLPISNTLYQKYTTAKMMHNYWLENGQKQIQKGNIVWMYGDQDIFATVFKEVSEQISAFPTVGIMAIAIARFLKFEEIIISGFTFFQSKKSHYFKEENVIPSRHHKPVQEMQLLIKWINEDKINYILDEKTAQIIGIDATVKTNTT